MFNLELFLALVEKVILKGIGKGVCISKGIFYKHTSSSPAFLRPPLDEASH